MKFDKKMYLLFIALLGCSVVYGAVKSPTTTQQAQDLVDTAQKSSDIKQVTEIYQALQKVRKKFPTPFQKVDQRLKALRAAKPSSAISSADKQFVAKLQKQLDTKMQELQAAQKVCQEASEDQTKTIDALKGQVESLKQQLKTCQLGRPKGPPGPPPGAKPKPAGPPGPPPGFEKPKVKAPAQPAPSLGRSGLLADIRKGTTLKKASPQEKPANTQDTLLDIIQQRRTSIADDDNDDQEDDDWV